MNSPAHEVEYQETSEVLLEYGGLVAPMMLGGEWPALLAFLPTGVTIAATG